MRQKYLLLFAELVFSAPKNFMNHLKTLNDLLPAARENHYAVPGFDCVSDIYIRAVLDTAQEEMSPVIIMALERDLAGRGIHYIAGLVRAVAPCYDIPVVLHLDHASNLEIVRRAIDHGFSSVMFDGSALPFEENVVLSAETVALARPHGLSVEAELGCLTGFDVEGNPAGAEALTQPEDVARFVRETGVDALAISFGTAHGVYSAAPRLNIALLKEINAVSPVPLVMHGGSGTPDAQVREAILNGITKFNVYADSRMAINSAFSNAVDVINNRPDELPELVFKPLYDSLTAQIRAKIRLAGSSKCGM